MRGGRARLPPSRGSRDHGAITEEQLTEQLQTDESTIAVTGSKGASGISQAWKGRSNDTSPEGALEVSASPSVAPSGLSRFHPYMGLPPQAKTGGSIRAGYTLSEVVLQLAKPERTTGSMSRVTPKQGLQPSLLDRLIDPESAGTAILTGYNVEQMYQAVLRDLEALLNTRQIRDESLMDDPELSRSILTYGLPDFVTAEALSATQRTEIGHAIRQVIEQCEPRLRDVHVTLLSKDEEAVKQRLRFRVAARLNADPSPDVSFDTILEMASGHYQVTETQPT